MGGHPGWSRGPSLQRMPELSVIIPTYNRKQILLRTLAAYQAQSAHSEILEVLVLDDGSKDGTLEAVADFSRHSEIPIRHSLLAHRGPAAARNHGIHEARGSLVLFGDDDIVPSPDLVAEHLAWHKRLPQLTVGVLGLVEWAPEVNPTPFMQWLGKDGPLFNFRHLKPGQDAGFRCFYSCNISLKTQFLRENGTFDEDFKTAAFEDTELGFRLEKRGLRLLYNPKAVGYHHRRMSFADVCRRARAVAESGLVFRTKPAGRYLAEVEASRERSLGLRVKRRISNLLRPLFGMLRPVLDTHIRLPRYVYARIYDNFAALPADCDAGHGEAVKETRGEPGIPASRPGL